MHTECNVANHSMPQQCNAELPLLIVSLHTEYRSANCVIMRSMIWASPGMRNPERKYLRRKAIGKCVGARCTCCMLRIARCPLCVARVAWVRGALLIT